MSEEIQRMAAIGDLVLYVIGQREGELVARPAVVVRSHDGESVNLQVFLDDDSDIVGNAADRTRAAPMDTPATMYRRAVPYAQQLTDGHWSYFDEEDAPPVEEPPPPPGSPPPPPDAN